MTEQFYSRTADLQIDGPASELCRDWSCAGSLLPLFFVAFLAVFFALLLTVLGPSVDEIANTDVLSFSSVFLSRVSSSCVHQLKYYNPM